MRPRAELVMLPFLAFSAAFCGTVSLSGKVTYNNGDPLPGITVAVPTATGQRETQTDNQGNYSFSIDEGTYQHLRIRSMGATGSLTGIPKMLEYVAAEPLVVSGNTVKNVAMPRFYQVQGTVRSPGGAALRNLQVTLSKWTGMMTELPIDNVNTDSAGHYAVYCSGGQAKLALPGLQDSGFAAIEKILALANDTTLDLAYAQAPALSGKVLTHDSVPVAGIVVAVVKDGNQIEKRTDAQGRFSFSLSTGTVTELRVRAMADTISAVPANMEFDADKNFTMNGDLVKDVVLPQFPQLSGKVLGTGSAPLAGLEVTLYAWDGNMRSLPYDKATTDAEGNFAVRGRAGANQLVIAPPADGAYAQFIADIDLARDSACDIPLPKGAVFDGKVSLFDGTLVKGVTIAVANGLEQKETHTDSLGRFRMILQPGKYGDFRVRNMSEEIPGVPKTLEFTVVPGGITLSDSLHMDISLPPFRPMAGKVVNALGAPVPGITLSSAAWKDGWTQLPYDESTTSADGSYELFLPLGTNWIVVRPPVGSPYATTSFTQSVDGPLWKEIVLADQAKGVASVQPSVVSQGQSGKLNLIGVNTRFTDGVDSVSLGEGVTVSEVVVHSDISITGKIRIAGDAAPGLRPAKVYGKKEIYVGSEIFTVTAPASADLNLDAAGKLTKTVVIEDATGTQLKVDSGTVVKLPNGANAALSFEAPIIKNDTVQPGKAEFLQVQREFFPDGARFDPPATLTYHYQEQDVKGIDESQMRTFKYDNVADTVVAEYKVISRDTARNILKQEVKTFSLFRLAQNKGGAVSIRGNESTVPVHPRMEHFSAAPLAGSGRVALSFRLQGVSATLPMRFRLVSVDGAVMAELRTVAQANGSYRLEWPLGLASRFPAAGLYWVLGEVDGGRQACPVTLGL